MACSVTALTLVWTLVWELCCATVAHAAPQLSVCVYVLTEISMDTLSQYACVHPTLLGVLYKRTQQCWTTAWLTAKQRKCWALVFSSFNVHPTTSNNVQQVPTTLNRVCKRAKHVHWTVLGACSVSMFSVFARGLRAWFSYSQPCNLRTAFIRWWTSCMAQ